MKKLLSSGESSTVCPLSYLLFINLFILDWTKSSGKPFCKKKKKKKKNGEIEIRGAEEEN